jgi:hypothetical protein
MVHENLLELAVVLTIIGMIRTPAVKYCQDSLKLQAYIPPSTGLKR